MGSDGARQEPEVGTGAVIGAEAKSEAVASWAARTRRRKTGEQGPPILVRPVRTAEDLEAFIEVPFRLNYRRAFWAPPLRRDVRRMLDPKIHPFHQHGKVTTFLAYREGESRPAGRIAAIVNQRHQQFHEEKTGFFGFLEAENDEAVFEALLREVAKSLRAEGCDVMRGPASFSTNEECGVVVEGFDRPSCTMMPWNPRHYPKHLEALGGTKAMDLLSYWMDRDDLAERLMALLERSKKRLETHGKLVLREVNMNKFDEEIRTVLEIYNSAWEKNWGFVPMTPDEVRFLAAELKPILDKRVVLVAEIDGRAVGFALSLPDLTPLQQILNGSLSPFGILKALLMKKHVTILRVLALGVVPEYRQRGLDVILYGETARRGLEAGYMQAEFSWILENNPKMNAALEAIGAYVVRKHRLYDFKLIGDGAVFV